MSSPSSRATAPIISRPDHVRVARRTFWGAVTALFWVAYIYLWMPLVTLLLWFLGVRKGYAELYLRENTIEPFVVVALPIMALIATVMLVSWAEYNRHRFSGKDRRSAMDDIPLNEVAQRIGTSADVADQLLAAKAVTLHMDSEAVPVSMSKVLLKPASSPSMAR